MSSKKAKLQGEMRGAFVSAKTEITRRVTIPEDQLSDELLWGIPNHVTLKFIATSLPWRAWQVAATLSADWQRAFQGRMVYNARVRWQTTQTFFAVLCDLCTYVKTYDSHPRFYTKTKQSKRTLSLFSPSEERCFRLPPFPGCHSGLPDEYNYVILDGAIYNLGGARNVASHIPSKELHVLDLARHPLEWRQCASMQAQRRNFRNIGVMHGKIFVFAGNSEDGRNEVYDPKVDAWSWIAPIRPQTQVISVFSVGQQFFVLRVGITTSSPLVLSISSPLLLRHSATMEAGGNEVTGESNLMANRSRKKKLVVKDGRRGPKLITTSDDDAEDDMDGLHEIIANRLAANRLAGLDSDPSAIELARHRADHRSSFPDRDLANDIEYVEEHGHRAGQFLRVYDPVKNEWTAFERESLGTHHVENPRPEITLDIRKRKLDGEALVWSMSL